VHGGLWGTTLTGVAAPIALIRATQLRFTPVRQASQLGSEDLPSVAKNAKDEVMHIAGDFAKIISGGKTAEDHGDTAKKNQGHSTGMSEDFVNFHRLNPVLLA
jgi:hypothetical protein